MLRVARADLGRTSRDPALVQVQLDEDDLDYLIDVMEGEQLRTPRDGAPPDYLDELRGAQARLATQKRARAEGPGLRIIAIRND